MAVVMVVTKAPLKAHPKTDNPTDNLAPFKHIK